MKILAPAGNMASFLAALKAGADAVYFGLESFNARSSAGNFTFAELKLISALAKHYKLDLYLTLNTLLSDQDFPEVVKLIVKIKDYHLKGVIIQDISLLPYLKKYPHLEIVASTQMSICNTKGVNDLEKEGFGQIVLARELTLKDLEEIKKSSHVKLEIFGHGAMCYSMSGQCLISAMVGGRSGNSGQCAQICRKRFKLGKKNKYFLSMNDLRTDQELAKIAKIGIDTLKIEGRMRSPEYVYSTVRHYKGLLTKEIVLNSQEYSKSLEKNEVSFNRGFSSGYLKGYNPKLINTDNQADRGIFLGKVVEISDQQVKIKLKNNLQITPSKGDGISIKVGEKYFGFRLEQESVKEKEFLIIKEQLKQFKQDSQVYLNYLASITEEIISEEYRIPLKLHIYNKDNQLILDFIEQKLSLPLEPAKDLKTDLKDLLEKKLNNFKHELFFLKDLKIESLKGSFLPYSLIRNTLTNYFEQKFQQLAFRDSKIWEIELPVIKRKTSGKRTLPHFTFQIESENQQSSIKKFLDKHKEAISFSFTAKPRFNNDINNLSELTLPTFIKDSVYPKILEGTKDKAKIWISNPGEIELKAASKALTYHYNIKNSKTFNYWASKSDQLMLSLETDLANFSFKDIETSKAVLFLAGYPLVMTNLNCLFRDNFGCKNPDIPVLNCQYQNTIQKIIDPKGAHYPVRCNLFHQTEIYHHSPLFPLKEIGKISRLPISNFYINCEFLTSNELADILNLILKSLLNKQTFKPAKLKNYSGSYLL